MHRDVGQEVLQDGFLLAVRQSQNLLSNHILDFFFFWNKNKDTLWLCYILHERVNCKTKEISLKRLLISGMVFPNEKVMWIM